MNKDRKIGKLLVYLSLIILIIISTWEYVYYPNEVGSGWLTVTTLFVVSLPMLIVGLIFIIKNKNG